MAQHILLIVIRERPEEIKKQIVEITGGDNVKYVYDALNDDHTLAVSLLSNTEKGVVAALLPTTKIDEGRTGEKMGYDVRKVFGASHAQPEFMRSCSGRTFRVGLRRGLSTRSLSRLLGVN